MQKSKNPRTHDRLARRAVNPVVRFYLQAVHLKHLYRQGWLTRGVPAIACESVAEHSFGVALLAAVLAPKLRLNVGKAVLLGVLHDLAEAVAGDITPAEGIPKAVKHAQELAAMRQLCGLLPDGTRLMKLWDEYEHGTSREARFVKELDKLEMSLQATVYADLLGMNPKEFHESAARSVRLPALRRILSESVALGRRRRVVRSARGSVSSSKKKTAR